MSEFNCERSTNLEKIREIIAKCNQFFEKLDKKHIPMAYDDEILDMDIRLSKLDHMIEAYLGKCKVKIEQIKEKYSNPTIQNILIDIVEQKMKTVHQYEEEVKKLKDRFEYFLLNR